MKKINLFAVALSAFTMSLTSCSSDEEIEPESPIEHTQEVGQGAYLAMNLNMITASSTRGEGDETTENTNENVVSHKGSKDEYTIKSAKLLIFEGDVKEDGTPVDRNYSVFKKSYDLSTSSLNEETSDAADGTVNSISNGGKTVAYLEDLKKEDGKRYYALVLVNKINFDLPQEGTTFAAWNETAVQAIVNSKSQLYTADQTGNGSDFFMASALLKKSTTEAECLEDITDHIQLTREKAFAETSPVNIYVERGVAKLSFTEADGKKYWTDGESISGNEYPNYKIKFDGWFVDNVDKYTYPVHTLGYAALGESAAWGIQSIGETVADGDDADWTTSSIFERLLDKKSSVFVGGNDRIYWSYTPRSFGKVSEAFIAGTSDIYESNYRTDYDSDDEFNTSVYTGTNSTTNSASVPYCYIPENCQLYKYMTKGTNTRVIFKAHFTPDKYTEGDNVIMIGDKLVDAKDIKDAFETVTGEEENDPLDDFDIKKLNETGKFATGALASDHSTKFNQTQLDKVNTALNLSDLNKLSYYKNGICYYIAYVRHISNTNANWSTGAYTIAQLGRYGVVRNNWYDMQVADVYKLGKPYVPDLPDGPGDDPQTDDEEYYIKVNVNILAWVKHDTVIDDLE